MGRNLLYADNGDRLLSQTSTNDGYGSVNITVRICKCKHLCDSRRSLLSGV